MRKTVWILAATLSLILVAGRAKADDPKFAVVTINNGTPDVTVTFEWRFGNDQWQKYTLAPGKAVYLYRGLDANGKSPSPQIRFQEGINKAKPFPKTVRLNFNAAPDVGTNFGYSYTLNRDTSNNDYIHLDDTSGQ
jgi:hypothetical protein